MLKIQHTGGINKFVYKYSTSLTHYEIMIIFNIDTILNKQCYSAALVISISIFYTHSFQNLNKQNIL